MSRSNNKGMPHPTEFPIGSAESRAAARALLESQEEGVQRLTIVLDMANRPPREGEANGGGVGSWQRGLDGNLWRTICIPRGADEETQRRLLATP